MHKPDKPQSHWAASYISVQEADNPRLQGGAHK